MKTRVSAVSRLTNQIILKKLGTVKQIFHWVDQARTEQRLADQVAALKQQREMRNKRKDLGDLTKRFVLKSLTEGETVDPFWPRSKTNVRNTKFCKLESESWCSEIVLQRRHIVRVGSNYAKNYSKAQCQKFSKSIFHTFFICGFYMKIPLNSHMEIPHSSPSILLLHIWPYMKSIWF